MSNYPVLRPVALGAIVFSFALSACKPGLTHGDHPRTLVPDAGPEFDPPFPACGGDLCLVTPPKMLMGPVKQAAKTPPPISGGTLLQTNDGKLLVAADPDRDQLYFVDTAAKKLAFTQPLQAGDEPGRVVEDAAGRIHVVLRSAGAIASLSRLAKAEITRREVCDQPRGLAYDKANDQLVVACAEGKLVRVAADPSGGVASSVDITRGARDVIVRADAVLVTYFRSAALVRVKADGSIDSAFAPPKFAVQPNGVLVGLAAAPVTAGASATSVPGPSPTLDNFATPTTAWRALDVPERGVVMLHERANLGDVQLQPGGYGGGQPNGCQRGIVRTALTLGVETESPVSVDIADASLAVDIAVDRDGAQLALVAPGNFSSLPQLQVHSIGYDSELSPIAATAASSGVPMNADAGVSAPCLAASDMGEVLQGQATAVVFVNADMVAVQEREPAAISFVDVRAKVVASRIDLKQPSSFDTGHALFHLRASSGLACASCHAEAGDDGHVWTFDGIGPRRTQNLRGGILGTEPFHWAGDMADFSALVHEVFVRRMGGFAPNDEQTAVLARWIDRQPAFITHARDEAAAARGEELFHSEAVGCGSCHSGPHFTNNDFADVGKGVSLQVPSLRGVSFRVPLMHDGCAKSLRERFNPNCGGGDAHGHTSQLNDRQLDDLVAYLETL